MPKMPMAEHNNQSGNDAPNNTMEGAGEHPVRNNIINTVATKFFILFITSYFLIMTHKNGLLK
ncbi:MULTISPECIES: hypothetical protein [Proteus]|uniref:Uncharacterized protein n=1 Tax=Proteus appendicitidis TaxID=3034648 RepID=A0ABY8YE33_9GAMM|nr:MULTISPECIES: hypothetical protein [Proteus]WIV90335.1 hypothetical protein QQS39_06495 [Proteus sp. HZ0627]